MRKTTESKKEKIINFYKENKDILDEFIAIFVFGFISIAFLMLNLDNPHGIQIMLCIILFYILMAIFCVPIINRIAENIVKSLNGGRDNV